jgi:signal transduction histidine kinase
MIDSAERDLVHSGIEVKTLAMPVEIYADELATRVMYNLLENAVRHGKNLTQITISTEEQKTGELSVVVVDNGVGVPDPEKELIFRYGYGTHTGLGLALSRDIMFLTGINIRETGIAGRGARFEIIVPAGGWRRVQEPTEDL